MLNKLPFKFLFLNEVNYYSNCSRLIIRIESVKFNLYQK